MDAIVANLLHTRYDHIQIYSMNNKYDIIKAGEDIESPMISKIIELHSKYIETNKM